MNPEFHVLFSSIERLSFERTRRMRVHLKNRVDLSLNSVVVCQEGFHSADGNVYLNFEDNLILSGDECLRVDIRVQEML